MGKHSNRQRKRPEKSKRYLNEDHILRLYANAADGETSLLKTMDRGSKIPRNAMKSDHRQRLEAIAVDGETSLSKTMGLGSKRPRNARKSIKHSNVFADGDSSEEEPVFNLDVDALFNIDEDIQPDRFSAKSDSINPQNSFNMDFLGETTSKSFEAIKQYLNSMSKKMQIDAVYSCAHESVGSLSELSGACNQLEKLEPLVREVKEKKDGAKGGKHRLELKQMLLLTYCQAIVFHLILKAEGHAVQDHPVEGCLVEIKAMIEQMRQIEAVANCHWTKRDNKYVNLSMEMLKMREDLLAKVEQKRERNQKNSSMPMNIYIATQDDFDDDVHPVATGKLSKLIPDKGKKPKVFSGDEDLPVRDLGERRRKHELRALENEQVDAKNHRKRLDANAAHGETSLSKTMGRGSKRPRNARKSDHRQRLDANAADGETSLSERPSNAKKNVGKSYIGLGKKVAADNDDDESSENDFYKEVKRQRTEKLNAKAALYTRTPRIPVPPQPLGTDEIGNRRPITEEMWKNKGLTRYRKKRNSKKNRLKKYKMRQIRKHKAMMARRAAPYGGEPGGIDPYLIRSVRLNRSG